MARIDVDALDATCVQGLEEGDAGLMASVHAEDGPVLAPGSEAVSGQAAIEQSWQGALGQGLTGAACRWCRSRSRATSPSRGAATSSVPGPGH